MKQKRPLCRDRTWPGVKRIAVPKALESTPEGTSGSCIVLRTNYDMYI